MLKGLLNGLNVRAVVNFWREWPNNLSKQLETRKFRPKTLDFQSRSSVARAREGERENRLEIKAVH